MALPSAPAAGPAWRVCRRLVGCWRAKRSGLAARARCAGKGAPGPAHKVCGCGGSGTPAANPGASCLCVRARAGSVPTTVVWPGPSCAWVPLPACSARLLNGLVLEAPRVARPLHVQEPAGQQRIADISHQSTGIALCMQCAQRRRRLLPAPEAGLGARDTSEGSVDRDVACTANGRLVAPSRRAAGAGARGPGSR